MHFAKWCRFVFDFPGTILLYVWQNCETLDLKAFTGIVRVNQQKSLNHHDNIVCIVLLKSDVVATDMLRLSMKFQRRTHRFSQTTYLVHFVVFLELIWMENENGEGTSKSILLLLGWFIECIWMRMKRTPILSHVFFFLVFILVLIGTSKALPVYCPLALNRNE